MVIVIIVAVKSAIDSCIDSTSFSFLWDPVWEQLLRSSEVKKESSSVKTQKYTMKKRIPATLPGRPCGVIEGDEDKMEGVYAFHSKIDGDSQ